MSEKVHLQARGLATELTDVLFYYQQNRILCDCRIQCCDGEVYAHKIVLAAWGLHGFYIDSVNTIMAVEFTTMDVNSLMKLIYSGNIVVTIDEAMKLAKLGNQIGIKLGVKINSALQEPLESNLSHLNFSKDSIFYDDYKVIPIKSLQGFQTKFSTTTNVRCRESFETIKSDQHMRNQQRSRESARLEDAISTSFLLVDKKHSDNPFESFEDDDDHGFEEERACNTSSISETMGGNITEIQTGANNYVCKPGSGPSGGPMDGKEMNNAIYTQDVKTDEISAVRKLSVESSLVHDEQIEACISNQINKSNRRIENKSDSNRTVEKKAKIQEVDREENGLIKCKHCLKKNSVNPFTYPDSAEGTELYKRHAVQSHASIYVHDFSCDLCGLTYKRCQSDIYMDHRVRKHGLEYDPNIFTKRSCHFENCRYWTLGVKKLRAHQEDVHAEKPQVCEICGATPKSKNLLRKHLATHQARAKIPCEICGITFVNAASVKAHIENVHQKNYRSSGFCKYCNRGFKSRYTYVNHMHREHKEIPSGVKVFQCTECDYVTSAKVLMKQHEVRHKQLNGLKVEKNEQCGVCQKTFSTKLRLNNHIHRSHTKKVYEQCPYDGCNKVFEKGNLLLHVRSLHERAEEFSCHICTYQCNNQGNLQKHLRRVHKEQVSTLQSRRDEAMLLGKGYRELTHRNPGGGQEEEEIPGSSNTDSACIL